jgi:hypothetical protein
MDRDQRLAEAAKDAQGAIDNIGGLLVPPDAPADRVAAVKASILTMAYDSLGMVNLNKKDYAAAEQELLKAVDASKAQPEAVVFLRLSVAQDQLKQYPQALESATKAAQYAPQGSAAQNLAKQQQARLQKLISAGSPAGSTAAPTPAPAPSPVLARLPNALAAELPAVSGCPATTVGTGGKRIRVLFRDASKGEQAEAALVLAVSWTFAGREGGITQPSADVVDPATGKVVEQGYSSIAGSSGIADTVCGPVVLSFSTLYKKKDDALRVYFKTGEGTLQLWWSGDAKPASLDQGSVIQLSPSWLAGARELPPTSDHPAGGVSISSRTPDGQPRVFFVEFTSTGTLMPGPKINGVGVE